VGNRSTSGHPIVTKRLAVDQSTMPALVVLLHDYRDRVLHVLECGQERMGDEALRNEGLKADVGALLANTHVGAYCVERRLCLTASICSAATQSDSSKLFSRLSFGNESKLSFVFDVSRGIRELSRCSQDRADVLRPVEDSCKFAFFVLLFHYPASCHWRVCSRR
jgi:hypothetical protein